MRELNDLAAAHAANLKRKAAKTFDERVEEKKRLHLAEKDAAENRKKRGRPRKTLTEQAKSRVALSFILLTYFSHVTCPITVLPDGKVKTNITVHGDTTVKTNMKVLEIPANGGNSSRNLTRRAIPTAYNKFSADDKRSVVYKAAEMGVSAARSWFKRQWPNERWEELNDSNVRSWMSKPTYDLPPTERVKGGRPPAVPQWLMEMIISAWKGAMGAGIEMSAPMAQHIARGALDNARTTG